jgi:glycosyltransferase involved in cell wall biosynthesis
MIRDRGFVPLSAFEHVPYFVPPQEEAHVPVDQSPHPRPFFLFVGRLEKIKGLQNLIPLFRNYPHADLLIAGAGNYEADLQAIAAGASNVVFLGSLQQAQLRALYRHAVAVIVPSICYEVFGIIILEAYMQRTPVIVRDLGGLKEVVEESRGGFAYRSDEELLSAMERLRTDPALREEMGELGWRKYHERWSEDAHLEMYFRVLEETAQKKFGRVPWHEPARSSLAFGAAAQAQPAAPESPATEMESRT